MSDSSSDSGSRVDVTSSEGWTAEDAARALDVIADVPVEERPAVFAAVNDALVRELAAMDDGPAEVTSA